MDNDDLKLIIEAIESGDCLAFLGAGACTEFENHEGKTIPGLPTGGQLAEILAAECQYTNGKDKNYDLLKVAEYFLYTKGGNREPLERALKNIIQTYCVPRPIHTVLAQLRQVKIIITTNYDNLLEEELRKYGRKLTRNVYRRGSSTAAHFPHLPTVSDDEVVLHKMHGTIEESNSIIITESDYINYLAYLHDNDRGMPEFFRKSWIPSSTLLFLGYSLWDWNFRVIWEGVIANYTRMNINRYSYALVRKPPRPQKKYWQQKNVDIFDCDLTDFARRLAGHFKLDIPQLGIEKGQQASARPAGGKP